MLNISEVCTVLGAMNHPMLEYEVLIEMKEDLSERLRRLNPFLNRIITYKYLSHGSIIKA